MSMPNDGLLSTETAIPSQPRSGEDRFVPLEQVFNLRDIGGFRGLDGHRVRAGVVYRSDNFRHATEADIAHLVDDRGVRTVIDLRRGEELDGYGRFPEHRDVAWHHLELMHLPWEDFDVDVSTRQAQERFLVNRYTAMLESGHVSIRNSLELIAEATPLVFHCMAGKDRTGLVAAVTLGLLGVSDADIAADYALTNIGTARWVEWRAANLGAEPINRGLPAHADAMLGTLADARSRFGSIEGYARTIGFTGVDKLRDALLE